MAGDIPSGPGPAGASGALPLREQLISQLEQGTMLIDRLGTGQDALGDPGVELWVQSVVYAFQESGRRDLAEMFAHDEAPAAGMASSMLNPGAKEFQERKRLELKIVKLEEIINRLDREGLDDRA
jgi:hypothetical protein